MQFADEVAPISEVFEQPENSPNSFLSTMLNNGVETDYAPDIQVKLYTGTLPPAGSR